MALFHFNRQVFRHLHWGVLGCVLGLSFLGIAAIFGTENPGEHHALRQAMWVLVGTAAFFLALAIDPGWLRFFAPIAYVLVLVALVGLIVIGKSTKGAASWYEIGPARVQPSEFMKVAFVLVLSDLGMRWPGSWSTVLGLIPPIIILAIPVGLILLQPDLGTSAVFIPVFFVMLLAGGAKVRHLAAMVAGGVVLIALSTQFLAPYQLARIQSFLEPGGDTQGRDYNIIQAQISLGSGQMWGRAFANEDEEVQWDVESQFSRASLDFLPEAHTDFIFNSLGEQFGFVGCATVISLYTLLTAFCVVIAAQARTLQWALVVIGLLTIILTHVLLNLGMALRLLPVTGLPLPFLSYGGSSMVTNFIIAGLICNVAARRYEIGSTRL